MALIRAALNAANATLASQWKEYFYADALDAETLAVRARKRVKGRFGGSRVEDDNIISEGSVVAVADGQCMLIVDQGRVVEFCSEPGEFVFEHGEPSFFCGGFAQKYYQALQAAYERFSFGGQAGRDQRVYYFNTKEILGNKYGTANPVPFRVVDRNVGLDVDIAIKCFGEYSYRIVNPMLFYANVCGNFEGAYTRDRIETQLRSELLTALQPAFASLSEAGIRYSTLPAHTNEIADALNDVLSNKWAGLRGIEIVSFGVNSLKASEEDERMIKELQRNAAFRDPGMAAAQLVGAQAQAMQDAAKNSAGAMNGFMGVNMAFQNGGMNAQSLYQMAQDQQRMYQPAPAPAAPTAPAAKPVAGSSWQCACGAVNTGKFCPECGARKPASYRCDKCGWVPQDPAHPPKFCPECGDRFGDEDING